MSGYLGTEEGQSEVWKRLSLWHAFSFAIKHQSVYAGISNAWALVYG